MIQLDGARRWILVRPDDAAPDSRTWPAAAKPWSPLLALLPISRAFALLLRMTSCHKVRKDQLDRHVAGRIAYGVHAATVRQFRLTTFPGPRFPGHGPDNGGRITRGE